MPFPDSTYEQTWREARASRDFVPGEHTPGPWRADQEKGIVWCNGSNGYLVRDYLCEEPNWNPADLRLIAAAPAMLSALRRMRELFEQLSDGDWRHMDATYVDQLIESDGLHGCDQVIAKAEGRSDVKD